MNKFKFLSVLLFLLRFNESSAIPVEFIVNGTNVESIEDYPFMVSIRNYNYHACGGTILNRFFILTVEYISCFIFQSFLAKAHQSSLTT